MYQDFITFLKTLFTQSSNAGSILPDNLKEQIPVDSIKALSSQMDDTVKLAGAVVTLVLALLACFLGYKLARLFMSITGFTAGAVIGYLIASRVLKVGTGLTVLIVLAGGILLSLFSYRIYMAGIFILCFFLAFIAAAALLPFTGDLQFFLSTLIGFIVGFLSMKFIRPVIILLSAIVGGSIAGGLITTVCGFMNIYTFSKFSSGGLTILVCCLGILVQFLTTSDEDEEKRRKKREKKKAKKREQKLKKREQKAAQSS